MVNLSYVRDDPTGPWELMWFEYCHPGHLSRVSHLQFTVWANRTGHIILFIFAPSHFSQPHSFLSLSLPPPAASIMNLPTLRTADDLPEQSFEGQQRVLIASCTFILVAGESCWAWRMEHPLVVDRRRRGRREKAPANMRLRWRIKPNRCVSFIHLSMCGTSPSPFVLG